MGILGVMLTGKRLSFWYMWRKIHNFFRSLATYDSLSPDVMLRYQINQQLGDRPSLSLDEWFESFWKSESVSQEVVAFVYDRFTQYSGLAAGQLEPGDRLEDDLHWTEICWFDWDVCLCDDFRCVFGREISGSIDLATVTTVRDLVVFLERQMLLTNHP